MQSTNRLSLVLRLTAAAVLLTVAGVWAATGAHLGWTQTSKVVVQHDEITGIDFPVREKTFVAGVEVLAVGAGFAAALAAASVFTNRRRA
jgi:ABC-type transporter Mla subunit MlaD